MGRRVGKNAVVGVRIFPSHAAAIFADDQPVLQSLGSFAADEGCSRCFIFRDCCGNVDFGRGCGKVNVVKGDSEEFSDSYSGGYGDEDLGTLPGVCMLEEGLDSAAGEYSVTGERVIFGTTFSETAELLWLDDDAAVSKVEENNLQVEIDGFGGEVQVFSFFGEL